MRKMKFSFKKKYKLFFRSGKSKNFIYGVFISFFLNGLLVLGFKKIRSLIPPPEIGSDKLIGYSQYYGYPLYFDTLFFFILFFFPILIFIFIYKLKKT